jgi:hypothetical protein
LPQNHADTMFDKFDRLDHRWLLLELVGAMELWSVSVRALGGPRPSDHKRAKRADQGIEACDDTVVWDRDFGRIGGGNDGDDGDDGIPFNHSDTVENRNDGMLSLQSGSVPRLS